MNNKWIIRVRCAVKGSIVGRIRMWMRVKSMGKRQSALKEVEKRCPSMTQQRKDAMVADMLEMAKIYHFGYDEYFYFHFAEKTIEERLAFFPDILQRNVVRRFNKFWNQYKFDDKGSCAELFGQFYKRDFCVIYNTLLHRPKLSLTWGGVNY